VVGQPVEQRAGESFGGEHAGPLVERQVAGDDGRAALVALAVRLARRSFVRIARSIIAAGPGAGMTPSPN